MRTGPHRGPWGDAVHWYVDVLKKYATFSGRARRQEYWMFTLISVVISIVLMAVDAALGSMGAIGAVYSLAVLIPSLAVTVRRLHDTDRSGWWILIALIPLVGAIILLVFLASDSKPHDSAYGSNPKQAPLPAH
jgi:uncharacterized membrane protein YhaH (DUF805 family)